MPKHKSSAGAAAAPMGGTPYEMWFHGADKDRSGYLTPKELKKALKAKGYKTSKKQFKEMFRQFDLDGDKKVTLQEYLVCMGQIPDAYHKEAKLREAFKRADRDGNGTLTLGELNSVFSRMDGDKPSPDQIFKMVSEIDRDKSGSINYKEFIAYFMKHEGFIDSDSSSDGWD